MTEVILGFMVGAWLFTVGAGFYVIKYLIYPNLGNVRKDIFALNTKHEEFVTYMKNEMGMRKAQTLTEEEQATIERRLRARQRFGGLSG